MEKQAERVIPPSVEMTRVFNNDLILQGIAANLPLPDVIVLRTVNSKWSSAFHKAFYKKSSITLKDLDDVLKYFNEMNPAVNATMDFSFYAPLNDGFYECLFFPKFGLWIASLTLRQIWNGPGDYLKFQKILTKLPQLKELQLHLSFDKGWPTATASPEEVIDVERIILPKVKKLCVQIHRNNIGILGFVQLLFVGQYYPQIEPLRVLPLIWPSFPSVEDLTFDDPHCAGPYKSLSTPILLNGIPKLFPKLSGLHLKCNASVLTDLLNLDVKLSALTLDFSCFRLLSHSFYSRDSTLKLNQLLEYHKSTLKSFKLILVPPRTVSRRAYRFDLKFPLKMEKLETLSLAFSDFGFASNRIKSRFSIGRFNFDDFCPNLKKYELKVKHFKFPRLFKGEHFLAAFTERLRRHFIPTSVCLNVEEVLVPYPYVKGSDWESKNRNAKRRTKKYEDFVERLTLTFPNAVKEGVFPKPRPEGDEDNEEGDLKTWKLMADDDHVDF